MDVPGPVLSFAITPKTKADQEKLDRALQRLMAEDPALRVHTDRDTGQTIIGGVGELHLEIIVARLKAEFGVDAAAGKPQVVYKETQTRGTPVVLEPIMRVEVVVPKEYIDRVIGSLADRRGQLQSEEDRQDRRIITASVPLSEMLGYASELRSRTHGRATYAMHFDRYQPIRRGPGIDEANAGRRGGRS